MKMYERFIPGKNDLELAFENFCKQHNVCPSRLRSKSRENPLPTLRREFSKMIYKSKNVSHREIAKVIGRSREVVTNYINDNYRKNYRSNSTYQKYL